MVTSGQWYTWPLFYIHLVSSDFFILKVISFHAIVMRFNRGNTSCRSRPVYSVLLFPKVELLSDVLLEYEQRECRLGLVTSRPFKLVRCCLLSQSYLDGITNRFALIIVLFCVLLFRIQSAELGNE